MTNEMIVLHESQRLAREGKIKYTGRVFVVTDVTGKEIEFKETEKIHTYAAWRELGFQVQKGQKAVAQFSVWKYTSKRDEDTDTEKAHMFLKKSSFFSQSQVEKIAAA